MGAVNFSVDINLIKLLTKELPLDTFLETGTFYGNAVDLVQPYFADIFTIELSDKLYRHAVTRFQGDPSVRVLHGESGRVLRELHQEIRADASILYWLDAHWCNEENASGIPSQSPLIDELKAIQRLNHQSVILIDDARYYLSPPVDPLEYSQWPGLDEILSALNALSDNHKLMILNDVIVYYPLQIADALNQFAHINGIDWLEALEKSRQYDVLSKSVNEKEQVISELQQVISQKNQELTAKEFHIQKQKYFRWTSPLFWLFSWLPRQLLRVLPDPAAIKCRMLKRNVLSVLKWLWCFGKPRLNRLYHHRPYPMKIPKRYYQLAANANDAPTISMITPSYNQADFLERTLNSVLDQGYPKLQYVVQDGGSADGSREILSAYQSRLFALESKKDNGFAHAINSGFAKTDGEIMAWLNSDDLLLPGSLHAVAAYFRSNPEVDVVYGHRILIDEQDREIGRWVLPPHDEEVLKWADYVPQETMFWRRRIWEKSGGRIDQDFEFAVDWDLLLRFQKAGAKIVRLPRFLGAFRVHSNQKTSSQIESLGFKEMDRLRQRCHGRPVSRHEIESGIKPYLRRSMIYHALYRFGIARY